jgi:hypothetical protein
MIGSLYPRRAKQLVMKGRAEWLEEGRSLQLMDSSEKHKEEDEMTDDHVYTNNGRVTSPGTVVAKDEGTTEADSVLLYQAKLNVKDKKNLIRHVIAFAVFYVLLYVNSNGFVSFASVQNSVHYRDPQEVWDVLHYLQDTFPVADQYIGRLMEEATRQMLWNNVHYNNIHYNNRWYLLEGAMLFWGGWIAFRIIKRVVNNLRKKTGKKYVKDPVMEEYKRLKRMAEI